MQMKIFLLLSQSAKTFTFSTPSHNLTCMTQDFACPLTADEGIKSLQTIL